MSPGAMPSDRKTRQPTRRVPTQVEDVAHGDTGGVRREAPAADPRLGVTPPVDVSRPESIGFSRTLPSDAFDAIRTHAVAASPGVVAGRYELRSKLGSGGFGTVHLARDRLTDAEVAVKLLGHRSTADHALFRRETGLLRVLKLPGVVRFVDDGMHEGKPFLVTEVVDGDSFPGRAGKSWDDLEETFLALVEALDRVHAHGVIHRDLKPGNVLVTRDCKPVILDFGVSLPPLVGRHSQQDDTLGTPLYMAPEQLLGRAATVRSDLYALGVMLYEAITGKPAFEARQVNELIDQKFAPLPTPEPRLRVPRHAIDLIAALTATQPSDRPRSAGEVAEALGVRTASESRLAALGLTAPRLTGSELERLFHGPELGLHLRSDGAARLLERTDGYLERVAAEIDGWVRSGICFWDQGRIRISREALDRLEVGLLFVSAPGRAPARVADFSQDRPIAAPRLDDRTQDPLGLDTGFDPVDSAAITWEFSKLDRTQRASELQPGEPSWIAPRSGPAAAKERPEELDGALHKAREARLAGRLGLARAWVDAAVAMARLSNDHDGEERALVELGKVAGRVFDTEALDTAVWEVQRAAAPTPRIASVEQLLRVARRIVQGDTPERVVAAARAVPEFDDRELEMIRRAQRLTSTYRAPLEVHEAAADEALAWVRDAGSPEDVARVRNWTGFLWYRRGEFDRAAEDHLFGFENGGAPTGRLMAARNAVMALIEARRLNEAAELAHRAIDMADEFRQGTMEVDLRGMRAGIEYRLGRADRVDEDLVEALLSISHGSFTAPNLATQAAIAWRNRDRRRARQLGAEAGRRFAENNFNAAFVVCQALCAASGAYVTEDEVDGWMRSIADAPPGIVVQAAALFASAGVRWTGALPDWSPPNPEQRAEFLSPIEAQALLSVAGEP